MRLGCWDAGWVGRCFENASMQFDLFHGLSLRVTDALLDYVEATRRASQSGQGSGLLLSVAWPEEDDATSDPQAAPSLTTHVRMLPPVAMGKGVRVAQCISVSQILKQRQRIMLWSECNFEQVSLRCPTSWMRSCIL